MRKIAKWMAFLILSTLFPFNVFSCPDFSDTAGSNIASFQCLSPDGVEAYQVQIKRIFKEGHDVYLWSNESVLMYEFITDDRERNLPGYDPIIIYSAKCEKDLLIVDQRGNLYEGDKQIGEMSYRATFYQNTASNLRQIIQGISTYKGVTTPFQFNITCNRI